MTLATLALVLASAAIHSVWNVWTKQIRVEARSTTLMWVLTGLSALFYLPLAVVFAWRSGFAPTPFALGWMAASSVFHVVYFVLLLRGYRASDLSVVYPVARGTGPLLASLGAIAWLGEAATPFTVGGIALIVGGILVLTVRSEFLHAPHLRDGVAYGLLTGVCIAGYTLWDGTGVAKLGIHPMVYYWCGECVRAVIFTPFALADRDGVRTLWRAEKKRILGIAVLSPLSYVLVLLALRNGNVSHVAPARELSILFGAWLGARVLGEGDRKRRWIAAALFATGVIALAMD